jgi:hypothetical protein
VHSLERKSVDGGEHLEIGLLARLFVELCLWKS